MADLDAELEHCIVDAERSLGIAVERSVQKRAAKHHLACLLNHLYLAAQLVAVPATLTWLYLRAPGSYRRLRNVIVSTWIISLPVYALFPVAPPRIADGGVVDTITTQTGFALDSKLTTALYNPLAAVPSLHAGFALAVGVAVFRRARVPSLRLLAASWPAAVGLAVVATGNHFVLDIAAGILAALAGLMVSLWAERLSVPALGLAAGRRQRSTPRELPARAAA